MGTEPHFLASCITCEAKRKAAHFSRPRASLASWEAEHPLAGWPHSRQRAGCFSGCERHGPAGNPTASPGLLSTCQAESAGLLFHSPQPARKDMWCYYRSELNSSKISIWNEVPVELHKEGDNQKRSLTRKGTPFPVPFHNSQSAEWCSGAFASVSSHNCPYSEARSTWNTRDTLERGNWKSNSYWLELVERFSTKPETAWNPPHFTFHCNLKLRPDLLKCSLRIVVPVPTGFSIYSTQLY